MRIILDYIKLTNWRGAENVTVQFNTGETVISGTNKTGKSTLVESYRWGFAGKDSLDRKDYDLKNTVKTHLNRGDHEIEMGIRVDGQKKIIRRVFREIWQRPRGQEHEVFKGNETLFFINDVPFNAGQFSEVIKGWFSDVQFKILTDPLFFNTPNGEKWKWTHMRDVLTSIAGEIDRNDIFDAAEIVGDRRAVLDEAIRSWGKLDNLKKEISEKKRKSNDELKGIPESIESQERTKPELLDWDAIFTESGEKEKEIQKLTDQIIEASKGDEGVENAKQEKRNEIREIEARMNNRKLDISNEFRQKNRDRSELISQKEHALREIDRIINMREQDVQNHKNDVLKFTKEKEVLWSKYTAAQSEQAPEIDPDKCVCPTCRREYPADEIEVAKASFTSNWNESHAIKIEDIKKAGSYTKTKIADSQKAILSETSKLEESRQERIWILANLEQAKATREYVQSDLDEVLKEDGSFNEAHSDFLLANRQLVELEEKVLIDEKREQILLDLKAKKEALSSEWHELRAKHATKPQYERVIAEIERLKAKQTATGQAIAELEGIEFAIENYNKARNEIVERRVNEMFPESIRFKLFDTLVSGETTEFCELYSDGAPWGVLNTGGKIQAGLACINVFQEYWNLYLPVWIDNRESTVEIPAMLSQVINLVVDPTKEKLTVS